ncbi:MAG: methyltransferase domain-containing protein [Chloroflexi bacterium]|nr:methyltransferase domain-containing protein [Chloroflexota bacterium]
MKITDERYQPIINVPEHAYEHWHRYLYALQYVKGKVALDIACGEGYGSDLLAEYAARVIGVDISEDAIKHASSRYVRHNLEYRCGRAGSIPVEGEGVFDVIVSFETIEHLAEDEQVRFLAETQRLLTSTGVLLISTPNRLIYSDVPNYINEYHLKEFYYDEFIAFLRSTFAHIQILGQQVYPISYLWGGNEVAHNVLEYQLAFCNDQFRPATGNVKQARYLLAVCSNAPLESPLSSSVLIDADRQAFVQRERTIAALQAHAAERERAVEALQAHAAERERAVEALQAHAAERERAVEALQAHAAERERVVEALQAHAAERERVVEALQAHAAERERAVEALQAHAAEREHTVQQLNSVIQSQEQRLQEQSTQLATTALHKQELETRLTAIQSSVTWSVARRLQQARLMIVPVGSRRDRVVRLGIRSLRMWRRNGLGAFIRHLLGSTYDDLHWAIDTHIPDTFAVGHGNVLVLSGWCFHRRKKIAHIQVLVNDEPHPVNVIHMPRWDVHATFFPRQDPNGHSLRSGFSAFVSFTQQPVPALARLSLRVTLRNRRSYVCSIGTVQLIAQDPQPVLSLPTHATASQDCPRVAICMTTYNPPVELFTRQIESIRNQTHTNWVCLISDDHSDLKIFEQIHAITSQDERFVVVRNDTNLGFYRNFERCLKLVPGEVSFVALCDQDDFWHPDKLETLIAQFKPYTTLVYSDMNIVDKRGRIISPTYWAVRPNNCTNLASLLIANTITGAASMFPRTLLDDLLPFPELLGGMFHDHWIGAVALALGEIRYVDRPLYDYVQHGNNVIGHYVPLAPLRQLYELISCLLAIIFRKPGRWEILGRWNSIYRFDVQRVQLIAQIISLRGNERIARDKRQTLQRFLNIDISLSGLLWLVGRGLARNLFRQSETMGNEFLFARGILWRHLENFRGWWWELRRAPGQMDGSIGATPPTTDTPLPPGTGHGWAGPKSAADIRTKIAPLTLKQSTSAPRRVNLLVPSIDLQHFFAGYITKFNLALRLARRGHRVRVVTVDPSDVLPPNWRQQLQAYQGLEDLFDHVELVHASDRSIPLIVNRDDVFIATTWWTAHIAHNAVHELGKQRFLYLIQEVETFTFPMGTYAALADETYTYPHFAIFSTEFLRDYFRQYRLGVFSQPERESGEQLSLAFQNAITSVGTISERQIADRRPRRLLFYARPEPHAARNMFDLGILALGQAIEEGLFAGDWEFNGIGTVSTLQSIPLPLGKSLMLLPRQSQATYRETLRSHDIGLSLMYTPHPSLVPIEMASAGMLVVTNTFANKTSERLREISTNIIAVEPTLKGILHGLREAVDRINDYEHRVSGANVNWSTDWDLSFNSSVLAQIEAFIDRAIAPYRPTIPEIVPPQCQIFYNRSSYEAYRQQYPDEMALVPQPAEHGYCPVCHDEVEFLSYPEIGFEQSGMFYPNLREGFICPRCHLNGRQRFLYIAVRHLIEVKPPISPYIAERVTTLYGRLQELIPNLAGSEYLGADRRPGKTYPVAGNHGTTTYVEHQDLTSLSFSDRSKDLIITADVLEHVPDCRQAFNEIYRVLVDGGVLLASIPFSDSRDTTIIRARLNADGTIEHLLPPEIHGNPVDASGSLAFYSYGWDLLDMLRQTGFSDAAVIYLFDQQWGFMHSNSPDPDHFLGPMLFVAIK